MPMTIPDHNLVIPQITEYFSENYPSLSVSIASACTTDRAPPDISLGQSRPGWQAHQGHQGHR